MKAERYLDVKVKPGSKKDWVEHKDGIYIIHTKEPARDGYGKKSVWVA